MAISDRTVRHITVRAANSVEALRDELAQVPAGARVVEVQIETLAAASEYVIADLVSVHLEVEVV